MTVTEQTARWFDDNWGMGYPFVAELLTHLSQGDINNDDIVGLYRDNFITKKEARYILHSNNAPARVLNVIR